MKKRKYDTNGNKNYKLNFFKHIVCIYVFFYSFYIMIIYLPETYDLKKKDSIIKENSIEYKKRKKDKKRKNDILIGS